MKDGDKLLYLKVPLEILSMSKVLNDTTGEVVVLDLYDKIVYCYLHNWYKLGGNSRFTPSTRKIAADVGIKKTKAAACVKTLECAGVVETSTQERGKRCTFSKVLPPEEVIRMSTTG